MNSLCRRRAVFSLPFFFLVALSPVSADLISSRSRLERPRAINVPAMIKLSVTPVPGPGEWIDNWMEAHVVFDVEFARIRDMLRDYSRYERAFDRIVASSYGTDEGGRAVQWQHARISALGFNFDSKFRIYIDETVEGGRFALSWTFLDSDGTIRTSEGYWLVEDVSEGGKPRVYIRYYNRSQVKRQFLLQDQIMALFTEGDLSAMLRGLADRARRAK